MMSMSVMMLIMLPLMMMMMMRRRMMMIMMTKGASSSQLVEQKEADAPPIPGVFGLSDSDDERETARREMKLAAWKLTCKGRWVEMPEDLRRQVEAVMGTKR